MSSWLYFKRFILFITVHNIAEDMPKYYNDDYNAHYTLIIITIIIIIVMKIINTMTVTII